MSKTSNSTLWTQHIHEITNQWTWKFMLNQSHSLFFSLFKHWERWNQLIYSFLKTYSISGNTYFKKSFLLSLYHCVNSINNLQGLQKVMVKDFSWNIIPWIALLFEKTFKQLSILDIQNYGFIVNTCHDTAKHAETRVGFPVIFSRLWWPKMFAGLLFYI